MNQNTPLEDRLEALGTALRARPGLADCVMDEVRDSIADGSTEESSMPSTRARKRRWQLLAASVVTVATVAGAVSIALLVFPSPSVGWADVTKAIQSQRWIRGTATLPSGKGSTMWLSPERQIWAFRLDRSFYFFDGREQAKYEYHGRDKSIAKLPLGEDDAQRVLPVDALSQDKSVIGPWLLGTEKILQQQRREVTEAGKTWIEFQMVLWRGEMNQATLRVDPKTRLPVYLLFASSEDKTKSYKLHFDYPRDGPADIYALGVPRETKIDNQMPSDMALRVLDAMAASRARIGDFRLIVGQYSGYPSSVVSRKGNRWRVDWCWPQGAVDPMARPSDERNWDGWYKERLKLCDQIPLYVCDGKTVWKNSKCQPGAGPQWQLSPYTAPQDLMSGEGLRNLPSAPNVKIASLLFPDLSPRPGWHFDFDSEPANAPGCVLVKRSARLATTEPLVGHEWYYVDPAKGHAVVRAELFNLPPDTPSDPAASRCRQTIRMEDFRKTPHGFWYPTVVHDTTPVMPDPLHPTKSPTRRLKTTVRYHFDFDVPLPDSLFTIEQEQATTGVPDDGG